MNSKGKETAQRFLAVIVIIAMLGVMGLPFSVIVFFGTVTYFIWRAVQRSDHEEAKQIFDFYIRANEILRDAERKWYGFEIANVIEQGESSVNSMIDPPPLVHYALGALYNHLGDYQRASEHLSFLVENELAEERRRYNPSPELRKYVDILRKLERSPAEGPQTIAAIRNLDRERRLHASELLTHCRAELSPQVGSSNIQAIPTQSEAQKPNEGLLPQSSTHPRILASSPPPPIAEVLRDLYEEKKTA